MECAVCLSDAVEGEKVRLLPKCNHGFHLDCIDMWFQSYSTCPLCRNSVAPQAQCASGANNNNDLEVNIQSPEEILVSGYSIESPDFPTNVLFWGDQTQVSTGAVPWKKDLLQLLLRHHLQLVLGMMRCLLLMFLCKLLIISLRIRNQSCQRLRG